MGGIARESAGTGLWRAEARATIALAYPLVLTNIAQALIHATDVVMLGRVGARALAAGALGVNLFNACLIFGVGLMTASAPMIASELGRRSHSVRDVRRTVRQSLWAASAIAVPFWLLLWHAEEILRLFGQDPGLSAEAARFTRAMMWGLLPYFGYVVLRSFVAALERPGWALAIGAGAVVMNAMVNYVLIFGGLGIPALGLLGAGIGSAFTNVMMFIGMAVVVARHRLFRRYHLFGNFWRADWPRFAQVLRLGVPIAVTLALEVTIFNAAVFLMGLIGTAELAAHAIAIQIASLAFMVPLGISQAATVRVGLAYGQGDRAAIGRAGWTSFTLGTGFMLFTATLLLFWPRTLVGLFIDLNDPANAHVAALAVSFLAVAALFQIVDGAQSVGAGMLRGLHDTTLPMVYAAVGYWVIGLGVGVLLGFHAGWGGVGIWVGLASGLAVVSVLMVTRWMRRERLGLA
ncbi:MAG: MATE family efflux transporter [Sphingomonas sp. SCN 67-18]|uniref:MATE family efflux transporter n=1 Tax=uncultured Sphingomonas sp. TaxID=158754 RepID=UPI0008689B2A|nr:MATE family efflux transporter [Sphingomonas sp. SCN 67-18]ODU21448.1 MAG: MATE family efflux transporter [Sphingomonas sp. SCN 67-18]